MSTDISSENLVPEYVLDRTSLDTLFTEARTANAFTEEPVTDEQLRAIYELTKFGPTSMNIQPMRITWVKSAEARDKLVRHMAEGNQAKTAAAPMVAVLSFDTEWHEQFPVFFPHAAERKAMFDGKDELRAVMGNNNGHMQAAYFIMAVRSVGLAAGPMGAFDAAGIDAEFHAGKNRRTFMVVNIGKPGENAWFPRLPRLDYDFATATV
ncbi:malonic semialdehyde reductase [Arthrobacter gengyunqii]|uniref:Malonic semialdehyde reductase n=1 Tax=Arthrobacter gengyunqii TaxID=2886940 RepID=A0A9X1M3L5_9MICC|nr:malonic semialdehyde reductase [Arthrobacter gengyunqii]MCC3264727.1 malonic semialdehyde reductase [Arthrobacter gengyunqii]MCC3270421.1 malonic semialdehyde reductase [Arthrobacter gengyunqii]UOY97611.1 malonic semialdehyde reductase [Arthrobacter gengyunqii]